MTAPGKVLPANVPVPSDLQSRTGRAAPALRLTLFGRMTASDHKGEDRLPKQRKSRAVLAVVALASPRPVLRSALTKLLWSRRDPVQARASLRQSVHEISELLNVLPEPLLIADRTSLVLIRSAIWVDALDIAAITANQTEAWSAFGSGLLLNDLAGLDPAFDAWIGEAQARLLRGMIVAAETALVAAELAPASPGAAISAAERLAALDPTSEIACRSLMTALSADGNRVAALAAFARYEMALGEAKMGVAASAVRTIADALRAPPAVHSPPQPSRKACLGVMPFRILGGQSDDSFSIGLAEDISASLSRFRSFTLIASPSIAAVQGAPVEQRAALLHDLQLDFLLDGTIQHSGDRLRVIVRLLDMRRGAYQGSEIAWSERFDGTNGDLLTFQDQIAAKTVAQVDPALLLREGRHAAARNTRDLNAYDLTMRAIPAVYSLDQVSFRKAGELLASAIAHDPDYASAHTWSAYWEIFLFGQGWATDPDATMRRAGQFAERAIALDQSDARALTITGHVRAFLERRPEIAHTFHEQALQLNPNLPLAWALSGLALSYSGNHEEAIRRTHVARRLSPLDPHRFLFDGSEMVPQLALGNHTHVCELARRAITLNPNFSSNYKVFLAALGHLGATAESADVRGQLLALEPGFSLREASDRSPLREAERDHYLEGLRLGGLAE